MNLVEEAMTAHWGEKCDDYEEGCPVCDAWREYENLVTYGETLKKEKQMTDEEKYPTYHDVIDAVIAQIKVDLAKEDETAIVELLARLPRKVLLSYLPEEETNAY